MAGSKKNKQKKNLPPSQNGPLSHVDDEDLMDDLFSQLDSRDKAVQAESAVVIKEVQMRQGERDARSGQDTKSRFRARQARKAAALEQAHSTSNPEIEARLLKEAEDEQRDIEKACQEQLLHIHEINPDGHCLYSAVADQLALLGILPSSQANYGAVRHAASAYIFSHPDDFLPFLEPSLDEDLSETGVMTHKGFERYCTTIRDTAEWGGEPEILALSRAYKVPIHVIQAGRPSVVIHEPGEGPRGALDEKRIVRISYHRKMYGLGEHYNSLRPQNTLEKFTHKMQTILSS